MKTFRELVAEVRRQIPERSVDDVKARLARPEPVAILDVREPGETCEGTLPGALAIPRGLLEIQIEQAVPDRRREIIVYCASGIRSALAARSLRELGYENVSSMIGGYHVWEAAGYGTVRPGG